MMTDIPLDPESLDATRPVDLHADCHLCSGTGGIRTEYNHDAGRWDYDECPSCGGTGEATP